MLPRGRNTPSTYGTTPEKKNSQIETSRATSLPSSTPPTLAPRVSIPFPIRSRRSAVRASIAREGLLPSWVRVDWMCVRTRSLSDSRGEAMGAPLNSGRTVRCREV